MPPWLRRPLPLAGRLAAVEKALGAGRLHTVCREARCPNRAECYSSGTATFLILGDTCTRSCSFCGIHHGTPEPVDPLEPGRVAHAVAELGLKYVVVTSVTRDDLPDGGAAHFAQTVRRLKSTVPDARVEVLVPDFRGDDRSLRTVVESGPDVLNHNVETVPRLYPQIRPQADYRQSIALLAAARAMGTGLLAKSGLMIGLGETEPEVLSVMADLAAAGCSIVTIGQYLRPSPAQAEVQSYVEPARFSFYEEEGIRMGFSRVIAGPYVRSSYHAAESCAGLIGFDYHTTHHERQREVLDHGSQSDRTA